MISLMCSHSCLCTTALIVFYTCIWIPFVQLKKSVVNILGFVFPWYFQEEDISCYERVNVCLPVLRFGDFQLCDNYSSRGGITEHYDGEEEEVCSICLVKFEEDDVVSQLQRCGHVFHINCIEKWLERDQFTCPLCRSFLFANVNSCDHAKCGSGSGTNLYTLSHPLSSWLSL